MKLLHLFSGSKIKLREQTEKLSKLMPDYMLVQGDRNIDIRRAAFISVL
jgi:hypothetical protein